MTISQDIFKGLSGNWQWASLSSSGSVRVHAQCPKISHDNVVVFNKTKSACARRDAFDVQEIPQDGLRAEIVERSHPWETPPYETDGYGRPLIEEEVTATPVRVLTVDEAENGQLWEFAKPGEGYVSVNPFGVVWFNSFKEGDRPRVSYDVEVKGVKLTIERTRIQPANPCLQAANTLSEAITKPYLSPPEAGKPLGAGCEFPSPSVEVELQPDSLAKNPRGRALDDCDEPAEHGWTNELEEAKTRARKMLDMYVSDGSGTRPALNELQYLAIFGE